MVVECGILKEGHVEVKMRVSRLSFLLLLLLVCLLAAFLLMAVVDGF